MWFNTTLTSLRSTASWFRQDRTPIKPQLEIQSGFNTLPPYLRYTVTPDRLLVDSHQTTPPALNLLKPASIKFNFGSNSAKEKFPQQSCGTVGKNVSNTILTTRSLTGQNSDYIFSNDSLLVQCLWWKTKQSSHNVVNVSSVRSGVVSSSDIATTRLSLQPSATVWSYFQACKTHIWPTRSKILGTVSTSRHMIIEEEKYWRINLW